MAEPDASWFGETDEEDTFNLVDEDDANIFNGQGDIKPRCTNLFRGNPCNALLAEFVTRPWTIFCRRCKNENSRS